MAREAKPRRGTDPGAALARASTALAGGDEPLALDALLDAWRALPAPELATVIEALSRRLEPHVPRAAGKLDVFQPRWLALARRGRAVDLPVLLATLTEHTERSGVAIVEAFAARAAALAAWPPDPRTAAGVLGHLRTSECFGAIAKGHQPAWRQLFALVVRHGDPRADALLAAIDLARAFRGWNDVAGRIAFVKSETAAAREALRARHPEGPPAVPRALASAVGKLATQVARLPLVTTEQARTLGEEPREAAPRSATKPKRAATGPSGEAALEEALARVGEALARDDDEAALAALLDAWRAWPCGELAALVDTVSAGLDAQLPELASREAARADLQATWLAVAREGRPRDLPRLLRAVTATHFRSTDALARVRALAAWPRDPRIAAGVAAAFEPIVFTASSTKPFWSALLGLAAEHVDRSGAETLARIEARLGTLVRAKYTDLAPMRRWLGRELAAAIARGRAREERPLPPAAAKATARVADAIAARGAPGARLLEEIYAAPDDDGPRVVYADRLQERGDPRGELIALQLAGRDRARQLELVARHGEAWLGALAPICWVGGCRFERGFLDTVWLTAEADDDALAERLDDPAWRTVRRLHLQPEGGLPSALLATLALDHLGLGTEEQLAELARSARVPYRSLGLRSPDGTLERRRFAALREVELDANSPSDPARWDTLLAPVAKQLEVLAVDGIYDVAPWLAWCAKRGVPTLRIVHDAFDGGWLELSKAPRARAELGNPPDSGRLMCDRLTVGRLADLLKTAPHVRELVLVGRAPTAKERARLSKLVQLVDA